MAPCSLSGVIKSDLKSYFHPLLCCETPEMFYGPPWHSIMTKLSFLDQQAWRMIYDSHILL